MGAALQRWKWVLPTVLVLLLGVAAGLTGVCRYNIWLVYLAKFFFACGFAGIFISMACIVRTLTPIFSLRREETRITWSQTAVLVSFGIMVIGWILILGVTEESPAYLSLTAIGAVMGWVFQDTIRSVVAFFYLRANDLIHIGDWIELRSHGVDGLLKTISLTTVTVENWDTTTSAFPTYLLHSEHFQNYQRMLDGKTHGRRMMMNFVMDTGWIRTLHEADVRKIRGFLDENNMSCYLHPEDLQTGMLNIEAYRKYLYHWLMNQPKVSHEPRLLVRWLEPTHEGMPLQVYAFITDTCLAPFEWEQSHIVEHVIKAMDWFDLQLYQSPSGYDASNSNVHLTNKQATYRKEEKA